MRPVLPLATSRRRKSARSPSKPAKTSSNEPDDRAEAVARVERRPLPQEPLELEVGQDRLQHERPHVEPDRQLVLRDGELLADLVGEDLVDERGDRLARRRVAVGEVLERRHVVRGRRTARRRREPRRGPRARSPASRSRAPSAGCSGRRSGRRPCRCPCRRRSWRRRCRGRTPSTTPAPPSRSSALIPAWYARAGSPAPARSAATRSAVRCSVT